MSAPRFDTQSFERVSHSRLNELVSACAFEAAVFGKATGTWQGFCIYKHFLNPTNQ